jgi:hypothetical protein
MPKENIHAGLDDKGFLPKEEYIALTAIETGEDPADIRAQIDSSARMVNDITKAAMTELMDKGGSATVITTTDAKETAGYKKPQLHQITPAAQEEEALALEHGANKYGERNWLQGDGINMSPYLSAMKRHIDAILDGEDIDPESGVHHLGHIRAGAGILLDARRHGKLIDNRSIRLRKE